MRVKVDGFRAIKSADVDLGGIVLLAAPSGSGKSSLQESIRTVLNNQHREDNFRHGCGGYVIEIDLGGHDVTFRRGVTTAIQVDGVVRSKVGKESLVSLFPDFPLKRVDFEDVHLLPYFLDQSQNFIFSQVPITDLFSYMFKDLFRLSKCLGDAEDMRKGIRRDLEFKEAGVKSLGEEMLRQERLLGEGDEAHSRGGRRAEDIYDICVGVVRREEEALKLEGDIELLEARCPDILYRECAVVAEEFERDILPSLEFADGVLGILGGLEGYERDIELLEGGLSALPDVDVDVVVDMVRKCVELDELKLQVSELGGIVAGMPDLDFDFVVEVCRNVSERDELLDRVGILEADLVRLDGVIGGIMEELREAPCERYMIGGCKWVVRTS